MFCVFCVFCVYVCVCVRLHPSVVVVVVFVTWLGGPRDRRLLAVDSLRIFWGGFTSRALQAHAHANLAETSSIVSCLQPCVCVCECVCVFI